jgi:hypothetical protein
LLFLDVLIIVAGCGERQDLPRIDAEMATVCQLVPKDVLSPALQIPMQNLIIGIRIEKRLRQGMPPCNHGLILAQKIPRDSVWNAQASGAIEGQHLRVYSER